MIVLTSDNGFFYGEHGIQNGKVLAYEPSIQVPLVLRGPGDAGRGPAPAGVTNADLAPTILDAAGAAPGRLPGRAFAVRVAGRSGARMGP